MKIVHELRYSDFFKQHYIRSHVDTEVNAPVFDPSDTENIERTKIRNKGVICGIFYNDAKESLKEALAIGWGVRDKTGSVVKMINKIQDALEHMEEKID